MTRHTIGVLGSGSTSTENITALLADTVDAVRGDVSFIFPISREHFRPGVKAVADYVCTHDLRYEVVVDASDHHREATRYATGHKKHAVQRVATKVVSLLERADGPLLFVLWDDENAEVVEACERAIERNIRVMDLTHGLDDVELIPEGEQDVAENTENWEPYTREELEGFSADVLKQIIVEDFGADMPPGRALKPRIEKILELQGGEPEAEEEEGEDADLPEHDGPDTPVGSLNLVDMGDIVDKIVAGLLERFDPVLDKLMDKLEELTVTVQAAPAAEEAPAPRRRRRS